MSLLGKYLFLFKLFCPPYFDFLRKIKSGRSVGKTGIWILAVCQDDES